MQQTKRRRTDLARSTNYNIQFCTSTIWAFSRFCGDEPLLFGTSDVCLIAALLFFLYEFFFVYCI